MSSMHDTVKECIGCSRVTYGIVSVGLWQLRGDDGWLPAVSVLDDVKQQWAFLCIKRYEEEVVKDEQLAPLCLSEFCLDRSLGFRHL